MESVTGGVRGTAFVSGGFVPESQRGTQSTQLMHVADWWVRVSWRQCGGPWRAVVESGTAHFATWREWIHTTK